MQVTEKRYWINGHQRRGLDGGFHTLTFSLGNFAGMISGRFFKVRLHFYKLV